MMICNHLIKYGLCSSHFTGSRVRNKRKKLYHTTLLLACLFVIAFSYSVFSFSFSFVMLFDESTHPHAFPRKVFFFFVFCLVQFVLITDFLTSLFFSFSFAWNSRIFNFQKYWVQHMLNDTSRNRTCAQYGSCVFNHLTVC